MITVVTTVVVYSSSLDAPPGPAALAFALAHALPFAAVNAAVEELIAPRYGVVAALDGIASPRCDRARLGRALWHPSLLGHARRPDRSAARWFLAKSVLETRGLGWAWFIHSGSQEIEFSLPFAGLWLARNSPARRVPSHGSDLFGERYAIDFIGVDDRHRITS